MPVNDQVGVGLMLGAVFWAALIGGAVVVGALAFFLFWSTGREIERARMAGGRSGPGAAMAPSQPAEEGGQLDEWSEDRLDRAA